MGEVMEAIKKRRKSPRLKNINLLKTKGYRGFRLQGKEVETEFTFEVAAWNCTDDRLIAIGKTPDEAYKNLIIRIDETIDGKC